MPAATAQAIAGVSANRETEIEAVYPSVAGGFLGQIIGVIMGAVDAIPIHVARLLGLLIVGAALVPLGLLAYVLTKLFGSVYIVTNRSIQARSLIGGRLLQQVTLSDVADVGIAQGTGYAYHRVGDVILYNSQGDRLMRIAAIQHPERLKHVLLEARDARLFSDESLQTIQRRTI